MGSKMYLQQHHHPEGAVQRKLCQFVQEQDLMIVTMGDRFKRKDLKEMIQGDKLMPMLGLEEDIKRDKF